MKTKLKKQEWIVSPLLLLKKIHKLVILGLKKGVSIEVRTNPEEGMINVNVWGEKGDHFGFYCFHDEIEIERLLVGLMACIAAESKEVRI